MRAKDRVIGWAFMVTWAALAYSPALFCVLLFDFLSPFWKVVFPAFSSVWALVLIVEGSHYCTVKGPDRAEFERQLWKLK